jgi:hypothetical protein
MGHTLFLALKLCSFAQKFPQEQAEKRGSQLFAFRPMIGCKRGCTCVQCALNRRLISSICSWVNSEGRRGPTSNVAPHSEQLHLQGCTGSTVVQADAIKAGMVRRY